LASDLAETKLHLPVVLLSWRGFNQENRIQEFCFDRMAINTKPSDFSTEGLCVLGNQNGYLVA